MTLLAILLAESLQSATARHLHASETCSSLTTTSLQLAGDKVGSMTVPTRDACCQACLTQAGCQMWYVSDAAAAAPFACEMFGLSKVRGSAWCACAERDKG